MIFRAIASPSSSEDCESKISPSILFSSIRLFVHWQATKGKGKRERKEENSDRRRSRGDGIRRANSSSSRLRPAPLFTFFPRGFHARCKAHSPVSVIESRPNYADPGVNDDYASLVWQFRRQSGGGWREKNGKKARK